MRNRRLLSLALLALVLGIATSADAATAVITVIQDANGAPNTWDARIKLWDDAGVGVAPTDTLGLTDFVFDANGIDGLSIDSSINVAPRGNFDPNNGNPVVAAGFVQGRLDGVLGIGMMALQPVNYADGNSDTANDPLLDQAVMLGAGTTGGTWAAPAGTILVPDANDILTFDADTRVASGTYTGASGSLRVDTVGLLAITVLENSDGNGNWNGPDNFIRPLASGIAVQSIVGGNGNGGGDGANVNADFEVQHGTVGLGVNTGIDADDGNAAQPFLNISIAGNEDTLLELGADQTIRGLTVNYAAAGLQGVDLSSPDTSGVARIVSIYPDADDDANRAAVEVDLLAAIANAKTNTGDGIFDSGVVDHPNAVAGGTAIGVTDQAVDANGNKYVKMRLTILGDNDLDGTVGLGDYGKFEVGYGITSGATWDEGDYDGDGTVGLGDYGKFEVAYGSTFTPEPGTMCLLALGASALIARRRRRRR